MRWEEEDDDEDDDEQLGLRRLDVAELEEAGRAASKAGDHAIAERQYSRAVALEPENADLRSGRALVRVALGEPHAGRPPWVPRWRVVFKRPRGRASVAVRKDRSTDSKILQALCHGQEFRVDGEPVEGWVKLLDSRGWAMVRHPALGVLLERVVEGPYALDAALDDCEHALELKPRLADAYLAGARCLSVRGELESAEMFLNRGWGKVSQRQQHKLSVQMRNLQKIKPKLEEAEGLLSASLDGEDKGKRALGVVKEAVRLGAPVLKVRPLLLRALLQSREAGRANEAKEISEDLLASAIGTPAPEMRLWRGAALLLAKEPEDAVVVLRDLVEEALTQGADLGSFGTELLGSSEGLVQSPEDTEWFEVVFKRVLIKKSPDKDAKSWCWALQGQKLLVAHSLAYDTDGRPWAELVPSQLRRLCEIEEEGARGFVLVDGSDFGLGELLCGPLPAFGAEMAVAGRTAADLLRGLDELPQRQREADELLTAKRWHDALEVLDACRAAASWDKEVLGMLHVSIAVAFREMMQPADALRHATLATQLCPGRGEGFFRRGVVHCDAGKWKESQQDLRRAQQLGPELPVETWLKRVSRALTAGVRKNYYMVLGLLCDCDAAEVKRRYRRLALECHPDKVHSTSEAVVKSAEARFKAVNEANEVLSNPEKRLAYDFGE